MKRRLRGRSRPRAALWKTIPIASSTCYGEKPGTNPEELLGAAHAACFTMSFVRMFGMANFAPKRVNSKSDIVMKRKRTAFPSPRYIAPSPPKYEALTRIPDAERRGATTEIGTAVTGPKE